MYPARCANSLSVGWLKSSRPSIKVIMPPGRRTIWANARCAIALRLPAVSVFALRSLDHIVKHGWLVFAKDLIQIQPQLIESHQV
jgi:hypothetical protein